MSLTSNVATFARGAPSHTTEELEKTATRCGAKPKSGARPVTPKLAAERSRSDTDRPTRVRLTTNTAGFLRQQDVTPTPTMHAMLSAPTPCSPLIPEPPRRTPSTPSAEIGTSRVWWISQSPNLPMDRRNGWVVTMAMEEFTKEVEFAEACARSGPGRTCRR